MCYSCSLGALGCTYINNVLSVTGCDSSYFHNLVNGMCDSILHCSSTQFNFNSNNTCGSCPSNCINCTIDSLEVAISCSSCHNFSFYDISSSSCLGIRQCYGSAYYNSTDNTCWSCPYNCSSCVLNSTVQYLMGFSIIIIKT